MNKDNTLSLGALFASLGMGALALMAFLLSSNFFFSIFLVFAFYNLLMALILKMFDF